MEEKWNRFFPIQPSPLNCGVCDYGATHLVVVQKNRCETSRQNHGSPRHLGASNLHLTEEEYHPDYSNAYRDDEKSLEIQ
jgi:hypothetical protein